MQRTLAGEGRELCQASAVTAGAAVLRRTENADSTPSFKRTPAVTAPVAIH